MLVGGGLLVGEAKKMCVNRGMVLHYILFFYPTRGRPFTHSFVLIGMVSEGCIPSDNPGNPTIRDGRRRNAST